MSGDVPMWVAFVTGFLSGFLVSIPIGPINITIINEAANHGFLRAFLVGLGAVLMEVIYCAIGVAGFSSLFTPKIVRATVELLSFVLVTYLGVKYMMTKTMPSSSASAERIEQRLHPHTAFMTGFVRVLGNPSALLLWITLSATWISHDWVDDLASSKLICVAGVGLGALLWFTMVSFGVSRGHGRFSSNTLIKVAQVSGFFLLVFGLIIGVRIVLLLAKK